MQSSVKVLKSWPIYEQEETLDNDGKKRVLCAIGRGYCGY